MDLRYILYDTAAFGAAANTEFILFQTVQGSDATHTESFTNSRWPGAVAQGEAFVIQKISAVVDYNVVQADIRKIHVATFIELRAKDQTLIKAPIALFWDASSYGGSDTTTAGVNGNNVGLSGDGYELGDKPISLVAGEVFRVRVVQGTALAGANSNIKICLHGILTLPG